MRIRSVDLREFCQHRQFTAQFHPGMNVIVGPNGSGKSTCLTGVYGGLTGDFGRNSGNTLANVCDLAVNDERSTVSVDFSHNGVDATAFRSLRPAGRKLTIGDKSWTSDKDFAARLADFLAVDDMILDRYVFVAQWDVFGVFDEAPAKRAAAFQRLFGLEKTAKLFTLVDAESKSLIVPQVPPLAEAQVRVDTAEAARKVAADRMAGVRPSAEITGDMSGASQALASLGEQARLVSLIVPRTTNAQNTSAYEAKVKQDYEIYRLAADEAAPKAHAVEIEAVGAEAAWAAYSQAFKTAAEYTNRATAATTRLRRASEELDQANGAVPVRPAGLIEDSALTAAEQRQGNLNVRVAVTDKLLATFDPVKQLAACPTCGTQVTALASQLDEARAENVAARSELTALTAALLATRNYKVAHQLSNNRIAMAQRELAAAQLQQTELGQAPVTPIPVADPREVRLRATEARRISEQARVDLKAVEAVLVTASRHASEAAAALESVVADLDRVATTIRPEWNEAGLRTALAQYQEELSAREAAAPALDVAERELVAARADLARTITAGAEAVTAVTWRDRLERNKALFHPKGLPQVIGDGYLRQMTAGVNEYLSEFQSPFHVEAGSDLTLTAVFPGGIRRPAGRLSGGQKVVLGLAFRLTVNATFASQLGLLCLDEPTVGLDGHNMACLVGALERLGRICRDSGLQVIMVTHSKELTEGSGLFDNVISLYK